jgi:hypothetical protein
VISIRLEPVTRPVLLSTVHVAKALVGVTTGDTDETLYATLTDELAGRTFVPLIVSAESVATADGIEVTVSESAETGAYPLLLVVTVTRDGVPVVIFETVTIPVVVSTTAKPPFKLLVAL